MNLAFSTLLHVCDPARNHWRAYRIEAGQDLLGDWLVEVTFGRIGPGGRTVRYVASNDADARAGQGLSPAASLGAAADRGCVPGAQSV